MRTATYTHKGWVGICPVYIGGLETEAPNIDARHRWLEPLHSFSITVYQVCFAIVEMMGGDAQGFPIRITGQLPQPLTVEFPE